MTTTIDPLVRADELTRRSPPDVPALLLTALTDALGVDPDRPDGRLRRVPSSGALHPVAIYLDERTGGRARTIRWHPRDACVVVHSHATDRADGIDVAFVAKPEATIAKYGDGALLHVVLDIGYAASAFAHAARAHGLDCRTSAGVGLEGVRGAPLATIAVGAASVTSSPTEHGDRHEASPATAPTAAGAGIVVQALAQLSRTPPTRPPVTAEVPLWAIRSRRSAPFTGLTRPVAPEDVAALLAQTSPDGWPADLGIWLATPSELHCWHDGRFVQVAPGDVRPELAAAAAGQHELTGVGALVVFTAPPACAVAASPFLAMRLRIAHLGFGLCVRGVTRDLGARPVGGWTATTGDHPWDGHGVIVHGLALGTLSRGGNAEEAA